jgi:hypothetical protein
VQIRLSDSLSDEIKTLLRCIGMQILHADTIIVSEPQAPEDFHGGMGDVSVSCHLDLHTVKHKR